VSWLIAALYDRLLARTEEECLGAWRAELLRDLRGRVLEVGAGTGHNVPHFPRSLDRLVLSEPDPWMRRRLARRARRHDWGHAEVLDASAEHLPLPDASFDVVVGTLVLCSVWRPDRALGEIRRVLRPGGRFVFLEHVAAEDRPGRLAWQRRVEPVWKRVAGNCHLTRRAADAIAGAGLSITHLKRESMRKTWSLVRETVRGVAVRRA
jgi:ubiquinone/menaquinone biosynthesis C-methylase UbiE